MKVNIKNAAKNCYDGVKELSDIIDDQDSYDTKEAFVEALECALVDTQPLLAAYCLQEHFSEQQ